MRKAQNVVEVLLIAALVAVISITVAIMYNHQKTTLANMSKSTDKQVVNLNTASAAKLNELVPYSKIETAGTSALRYLGLSSAAFESAMANNIQYSELLDNPDGKGNILQFGTTLSQELGLGYTFSANNITVNTLSNLVGVLNTITADGFNPTNDPQIASDAATFKTRFNSLLDASTASNSSSEAAGSNGYNGLSASPSSSNLNANYNFSGSSSSGSTVNSGSSSTSGTGSSSGSSGSSSSGSGSSSGSTSGSSSSSGSSGFGTGFNASHFEVGGGYATAGHSTGISSGGL